MNIRKVIIRLMLSLLLGSGMAVAADFDKGLKAYSSGDIETALAEFTPLAEQGHALAQYNLGVIYKSGKGVQVSNKAAIKWYTKSAAQGYTAAQHNLGAIYTHGEGVRKNHKTAFYWYRLAAGQGDARAQYNLGRNYYFGHGVLTDYVRAYMWSNLSAYNGYNSKIDNRVIISKKMTSADISKAQETSSRCLESGYTDC
jgi:TPR repeat protein